jgi:glycogen operon protein
VNFVTAHDGFTLRDLVSYDTKHNEANGEGGRDGADDNRSWNGGVEGETDDPAVLEIRARQQRNFLATLLLSQGVPMLLHGDELGRTQGGNNNGYAQDSPVSWIDWERIDVPLVEFVAAVARLRHDHPSLRRTRFFDGRPVPRAEGAPLPDLVWLRPDGTEMGAGDWDNGFGKAVGMYLNGSGIREHDSRGQPLVDLDFLVYFSAAEIDVRSTLPPATFGASWDVLLDTAGTAADAPPLAAGAPFVLRSRSVLVLRAHTEPPARPDHSVAASLALRAQARTPPVPPAPAAGTPGPSA